MPTTEQERQNSSNATQEIRGLRKDMEVQAATHAGKSSTQAATHAGTWSTMLAGAAGLVVGMVLVMSLVAATRRD